MFTLTKRFDMFDLFKVKTWLVIAIIFTLAIFPACGSDTSPPQVLPPQRTSGTAAPEIAINDSNAPDRVDVVYFHSVQRCVTCLCFEERITHVVRTHFKEELDSGKLSYRVVNLGDKANKNLAIQYGAVGSQLFVNSVKDGVDNIEDIADIWSWNCRKDEEGFDREVAHIFESKLKGES